MKHVYRAVLIAAAIFNLALMSFCLGHREHGRTAVYAAVIACVLLIGATWPENRRPALERDRG